MSEQRGRQLRPAEVIDAQGDLIERLDDSRFITMINTMTAQHVGNLPINKDGHPTDGAWRLQYDREIERVREAAPLLQRLTRAAYAYRVTPDMCQMVEYAASQLDDDDRFDADLAPTGCGIVRFDQGLLVEDIRGYTMKINWLVWGPGQFNIDGHKDSGTTLWFFNDSWTEPDEVDQYFARTMAKDYGADVAEQYAQFKGRWSTIGISLAFRDRRLGGAQWTPTEEQRQQVMTEEGHDAYPGTNSLRFVHALWLLLNQTVTLVEQEGLDRAGHRRAVKKNLPTQVTVVSLRRAANPRHHEGESQVEWSRRWLVRGHWAWRVCGKDHPMAQEAPVKGGIGVRVWINPYIKNAEHEELPLIVPDKLYDLNR